IGRKGRGLSSKTLAPGSSPCVVRRTQGSALLTPPRAAGEIGRRLPNLMPGSLAAGRTEEHDTDRTTQFQGLTGGSEAACGPINFQDDGIVRILVASYEILSRRIDSEPARSLALGRLMLQGAETAGRGINGKGGDGVVPTVRSVKELP